MSDRRPKTVYYLRAAGKDFDFQKKLAIALGHTEADRLWSPTEHSNLKRVICDTKRQGDMTCGKLVQVEYDKHQHLLVRPLGDKGGFTENAEVSKSDSGLPRDVVEGALWFVCSSYHFAISPSTTLRSASFTDHLDWLLRQKFKLVPDNQVVDLDPDPGIKVEEALAKSEVRTIKVGGQGGERFWSNNTKGQENSQSKIVKLNPGIRDMLIEEEPTLRPLFESNDPNALGIDLQLLFRVTKKQDSDDTRRIIRSLAKSLVMNGADDVEVNFSDNSRIKGGELILSDSFRVDCFDGIPSNFKMYEEMERWLQELINSGKVQP